MSMTNEFQQALVKIDVRPFEVFTLKESEIAQSDLPTVLLLTLFNGETYNAIYEKFTTGPDGSIVWEGHLEGTPTDKVFLAISGSIVQGNINIGNEKFQIRFASEDQAGDVLHVLKHVDQSQFPPAHDPSEGPIPAGDGAGFSPDVFPGDPQADDGTVADILIAYTSTARAAAGGQAAMDALINLAVAETNAGYVNSNVGITLNLVFTVVTSYKSSGSYHTDLTRLQSKTDGHMDYIHFLRDTYRADMVGLLIDNREFCGLGYVNASEEYAFQATDWTCATGNFSFAHEFGHIQGAHHDWDTADPSFAPFTYNHGYRNTAERWRTIMSTSFSCDNGFCTRINYWSNPDVGHPSTGSQMGVPAGAAEAANNRRTINESSFRVANFRQQADSFEPDDTFQTANVITEGVPQVNRNIDRGGSDTDWVRFDLTCNADVELEISGLFGDTRMWLYDSTGTNELYFDDDSGVDFFSKISASSLAPGTYFVRIEEFGNNAVIPNYTLSFDRTCLAVTSCFGKAITVNIANGDSPTQRDDVILGTAGADIISGLGGSDTICGLGGNDVITGGNGVDWISGGEGADTLYGDGGADLIFGNEGADAIYGGLGEDYIGGGEGFDTIYGGAGADEIYGDQQNDSIFGEAGNDLLFGGSGQDAIDGGEGQDTIHTGTGKTVGTAFIVTGGPGADTIYGGLSDDHIEGDAGRDTIYGDGGNDYLDGGAGADFIDGENGADTILGGGSDDRLDGGFGNDTIKGEAGNDVINGGPANDILNGNDGNDTLRGNDGRDTIRGGNGDDLMAGNGGNDSCHGGAGT